MSNPTKHIAIVPAAGASRRMNGPNKLMLPFENLSVIGTVLRAWTGSGIDHLLVVVRPSDHELADHISELCDQFNWTSITILRPATVPDSMRESVQCALTYGAAHLAPEPNDRWLLAPADVPGLTSRAIRQVIAASLTGDGIICPVYGDRPSHPISLPWSMDADVFQLPEDRGINTLVEQKGFSPVVLPPELHPADIDTPDDYESALHHRRQIRTASSSDQ